MTESLAEKLKSHDFTALTENGAQWVRKALHPAEPTIKAPRCPSHGIRPTATQEVIATAVVDPPPTGEGTWSMCVTMKNDPLCPIDVLKYNDDGTGTAHWQFVNQGYVAAGTPTFGQFGASDYGKLVDNFMAAAEQYRVTALSVTGVFIGASLSDQGSIVSAQMSDPHLLVIGEINGEGNNCRVPIYAIGQEVNAAESLVMGTSPYVSAVKEGFYVPYKMENPDHWHRTDAICQCVRLRNGWRSGTGSLNYGDSANLANMGATPYPWGNGQVPHNISNWLPPVDDGLSVTWCRNVARTSSFRITVRIAIEVMTRPASSLSSFCDLPALPDEHAVSMYREIASRMKDCYPSRDNDNNTLWDKIKSIAGGIWDTVSPALKAAVPGGGMIVGGVNTLRKLLPGYLDKMAEKGAANAAARAERAAQKEAKAAVAQANTAKALAETAQTVASAQTGKSKMKKKKSNGRGGRRNRGVRVGYSKFNWGKDITDQIMRIAGK